MYRMGRITLRAVDAACGGIGVAEASRLRTTAGTPGGTSEAAGGTPSPLPHQPRYRLTYLPPQFRQPFRLRQQMLGFPSAGVRNEHHSLHIF